MSDSVPSHPVPPEMTLEHFIARQPILDRNLNIFGYELLFRSGMENFFSHEDEDEASSRVMANSSFLFGIEEMSGGAKVFLNITRNILINNFATLLPNKFVIVELLETLEADPQVIEACRNLREHGFILALDDYVDDPQFHPFLDLAQIVKVDFRNTDERERRRLAEVFIPRGIKMLAEKVETQEDFRQGLEMGYSYFQGYFFSKPVIISRKDVPIFKLQYLRILKEINAAEVNFRRLAETIQGDVAITYKLLRYTNSVAFGLRLKVTSILQALALLGEDEFKKWISLLSLTGMAKDKPTELVHTSLVRAKFCELLAPALSKSSRSADLFLLGLFSLLDAILDRPLDEILSEVHVEDDVHAALLQQGGTLDSLLRLVVSLERGEWESLSRLAEELAIDETVLPPLYLQAVKWGRETCCMG